MENLYSRPASQRQLVVASAIQQIVSSVIVSHEVFHPDLDDEDMILVFPLAKVTADLKIATLYVNCLNKDKLAKALEILKILSPQIRKILSSRLKLRYTPEVRFYADDITEKELKLLSAIDKVSEIDQ